MGIFSKEAEGQEPSAMYDERKKVSKSSSCDDMIDETVRYFTQTDPMLLMSLERGMLSKPEFVASVKKHIATLTSNHEERAAVYKGFASFVWSYDILDDLINDESISDIKVFGKNQIRVKRYGKRETSPVHFRNDAHFNRFIEHVAVKNKVSISDQNALQSFVDKSSNPHFILRFNISTGFVNSTEEPYLHIRKIPKKKYTIQELIAFNMMDEQTAAYLIDRAQNGEGMLFCGKGASGKTTMMNVLIDYIPHDKSGLVIQENEELFSNSHPDLMFQHTVANRGEGKIEYGLSDLARNGLLVDLDYFVIGEIKGGEALYLLNAVYTG
ncbi:MAG: ATPase, T2SS/T4P/T4SS family, partial [Ruthenibacterium sp.]